MQAGVPRNNEVVKRAANDALKHNLEVATDKSSDTAVNTGDQPESTKSEKRKRRLEKKKRAREDDQSAEHRKVLREQRLSYFEKPLENGNTSNTGHKIKHKTKFESRSEDESDTSLPPPSKTIKTMYYP